MTEDASLTPISWRGMITFSSTTVPRLPTAETISLLLMLAHYWNLGQGVSSQGCSRQHQGDSGPPGSRSPGVTLTKCSLWQSGSCCGEEGVLMWPNVTLLSLRLFFACFDFNPLHWTSHSGRSTNNYGLTTARHCSSPECEIHQWTKWTSLPLWNLRAWTVNDQHRNQ